jgi:hypothetical protein
MEDCMKYQLLIVLLLGLTLGPAGSSAGATDISGTWEFSVSMEDARGPQNALSTFVLKQGARRLPALKARTKLPAQLKGIKWC